jgi:hypothetical protein
MRSNARARVPMQFIAGASIRLNLLKWLIVPLLIINLVGAGLVYWLAWKPAQTAFDQSLADTAWALVPRLKMSGDRVEVDLSKQAEQVLRVDHVDAVYFSVRNEDGAIIAGDADFPPIIEPPTLNLPSAYDGRMRKEPIRITTLKTTIGDPQRIHQCRRNAQETSPDPFRDPVGGTVPARIVCLFFHGHHLVRCYQGLASAEQDAGRPGCA